MRKVSNRNLRSKPHVSQPIRKRSGAQDTERFNYRQFNATFVEMAIHLGFFGLIADWTFILVVRFCRLTPRLERRADRRGLPRIRWMAAVLGGRRGLAAALMTILGLLVVIGPVPWWDSGLIDWFENARRAAHFLGVIMSRRRRSVIASAAYRAAASTILGARIDQCAKCADPPFDS